MESLRIKILVQFREIGDSKLGLDRKLVLVLGTPPRRWHRLIAQIFQAFHFLTRVAWKGTWKSKLGALYFFTIREGCGSALRRPG